MRNVPCLFQGEGLVHVDVQLALFLQPGNGPHLVAVGLHKHQLVARPAHQRLSIPGSTEKQSMEKQHRMSRSKLNQWRSNTGCAE